MNTHNNLLARGTAGSRPDRWSARLPARLLAPVGIVIGVYLLWAGTDQPGGAFQGGALLAAMWILAMMAGLTAAPAVSDRRLRLVLVAGPVVFLAIGLAASSSPTRSWPTRKPTPSL